MIVATLPDAPLLLVLASLAYLAYYVLLSLWLTFRPKGEEVAA